MLGDTMGWVVKIIKELKKHAEKDDCYSCKQLLKEPLIQPFLEGLKRKEQKGEDKIGT
jgi:hypothetical protein